MGRTVLQRRELLPTPVKRETRLYRQDPRIFVGITSRGKWSVNANKYEQVAARWEDRYKGNWKLLRFKETDLLEHEVPSAVKRAIDWLYGSQEA